MKNGGEKRADGAIITVSVGLGINAVLFLVKLFIGLACNSISILSDAINNLGDVFACGICVFSFCMLKRRNKNLSFGYGRMEYLADFLMAIIVCCVGGGFLYTAAERMILPSILTFTWRYFAVISVAAVIKIGLGFFYLKRNKKINSDALRASAIDSFTDAAITAMTLIGYSLNRYSALRIDAVFGIVISAFMLLNGIKLLVGSVKTLLGEKISDEERREIEDLCAGYPCIEKITGMSLHKYGAEYAELVLETVFTNADKYVIIENTVKDISTEIERRFGYTPKICIARVDDETEQRTD